jgi:hypothetical protein
VGAYDSVPTWGAGHIITAAEAAQIRALLSATATNGGLLSEQVAAKAASTSRASTTTMANDPDLALPLAANASYDFTLPLGYAGNGVGTPGGSIKIGFTVPSGATVVWVSNALAAGDWITSPAGSGQTDQLWRGGSTPTLGADGTSNCGCVIRGEVTTGGTAGSLNFQWAQSVSSATACSVLSRSKLILKRTG